LQGKTSINPPLPPCARKIVINDYGWMSMGINGDQADTHHRTLITLNSITFVPFRTVGNLRLRLIGEGEGGGKQKCECVLRATTYQVESVPRPNPQGTSSAKGRARTPTGIRVSDSFALVHANEPTMSLPTFMCRGPLSMVNHSSGLKRTATRLLARRLTECEPP